MLRFLSYHNAVPVAISILVLSSSAAFAATSDTVYNESTAVISEDNTYIASKDLSSFTPRAEIVSISEDADSYYVSYRLLTIDVIDYVWRDVTKERTLTVAKGQLGEYGDLGLFVTEQLKQVVDADLAYLREVQENARKRVTQKTIATEYSGLVGKFLDSSTEQIPGYTPVVVAPPPPEPVVQIADASNIVQAASAAIATPSNEVAPASPPPSEQLPLTIQMLGQNPARIPIGQEPYSDLGVVVTGGSGTFTLNTFVDDAQVDHVVLNAVYAREWRVRYEVVDATEGTITAERLVVVYDPALELPAQPTAEQSSPEPTPLPPDEDAETNTPAESAPPAEETTPAEAPDTEEQTQAPIE